MLEIGTEKTNTAICNYAIKVASETALKLTPAFWPPIFEQDTDWNLLKDNCKYEFRNYPYEFHNGGSWPMVNGFVGFSVAKRKHNNSQLIISTAKCSKCQSKLFLYENFNTQTQEPNGVAFCAWSAAATVILEQAIQKKISTIFN